MRKNSTFAYLLNPKNWWLSLVVIFVFSIAGVTMIGIYTYSEAGFIINLPIANYYEHGTYLTVKQGHAALMGVYGNLALTAILFCCQLLFNADGWKPRGHLPGYGSSAGPSLPLAASSH